MQLPSPPKDLNENTILIRLIDGISFRFFWATEKLTPHDTQFRPSEDTMSINELLAHIYRLTVWVHSSLKGNETEPSERVTSFEEMRKDILSELEQIKERLSTFSPKQLSQIQIRQLPFWNMINGPLADILTHIGQINTYRRLNGNPAPKISPFTGKTYGSN